MAARSPKEVVDRFKEAFVALTHPANNYEPSTIMAFDIEALLQKVEERTTLPRRIPFRDNHFFYIGGCFTVAPFNAQFILKRAGDHITLTTYSNIRFPLMDYVKTLGGFDGAVQTVGVSFLITDVKTLDILLTQVK